MPKSVHTAEYRLFLEQLRAVRVAKGCSQRELGRRLGQHHDFVSKCESGERQLNIVELRLWCRALEISWTEFLAELEQVWDSAHASDSS